jgi:aminopeptidase N
MLHTLRQLLEDDTLWRSILREMNQHFYHQTVTTRQIEAFLSERSGKDLSAFFNQYLRTTMIPTLEYRWTDGTLEYRYRDIVEDFDMPLRVHLDETSQWIFPSSTWEKTDFGARPESFRVDENFYVESQQIDP